MIDVSQRGTWGPWWPLIALLSHFTHKMNSTFFLPIVPTCDPLGWDQFWPQGHHMNRTDKGPQGCYIEKKKFSIASSFREEFWSWSSLFLCSNFWLLRWAHFWPQGNHMKKIDKGPQGDAKYQISMLQATPVSEKKNFKLIFFVPFFQLVTPRVGQVLTPQDMIWTNLTEVHTKMLTTKFQRALYPFQFETRRILKFKIFIVPMF